MLIFDSRPDPERHPDRLRTIAQLKGLKPKPVSRARILDIGCGTGLDILAHALVYPAAQFVGIDNSKDFIDLGNKVANELQITNVDLICKDIKDFSSTDKFDYLICHGVYSWVNSDLQTKIFELVSSCLAPTGLAYVSFNVLPGWHYRRVAQHLIKLFDNSELTVEQRVQLAIQSLGKGLLALSDSSSPTAENLKAEITACLKQSPAFIYHELLNFDCQAEYLEQFAQKVSRHGLQYLGDGRPSRMRINRFTEAERKRVAQIGLEDLDLVGIEQFWDFVSPPSLRGAILCAGDQMPSLTPEYSHLMDMYITSGLRAESKNADLTGTDTTVFSNPRELLIEVTDPQLKSTLATLAQHWPRTIAVQELLANSSISSSGSTPLLTSLGEYFLQGLIQLYSEPLASSSEIALQPKVFPLAISQAKIGFAWVTNSRFEYVPISEFDRQLIQCLDGTCTLETCQERLLEQVKNGKIEVSIAESHSGQTLSDLIKQQVVASLDHYCEMGLFIDNAAT